jgi:oligopeptide transport system ATP-binding protein
VTDTPILKVSDLKKSYHVARSSTINKTLQALDGVNIELRRGETLALVGESGCGKTTLARTLLMLEQADSGQVLFDGIDVSGLRGKALRAWRRRVQIVFQDPFSSLNERMSVSDLVSEPWRVNRDVLRSAKSRSARVGELLTLVGLSARDAGRFPRELSGGQRQRLGIARALALEPDILICDEPTSALDLSVQAQILNLLSDLREQANLSYLFISHDLAVVESIADRVAVMYLGRIVETAETTELFTRYRHPYTNALISAAPQLVAPHNGHSSRILLSGEPPSPLNPPSGCRFRTRCWRAQERCAVDEPRLTGETAADSHLSACHFPVDAAG